MRREAAHRKKVGAANRTRMWSAESRAKMSAASRGRTHSAETRAKMSAAHRGRPKSPVHRAAMRGRIGDLSATWIGDRVGYEGVHHRQRRRLAGQPCAMADASCSGPIQIALRHDADG